MQHSCADMEMMDDCIESSKSTVFLCLHDPLLAGMGAPARGTSFAGPITREAGFLGYNEIYHNLEYDDTKSGQLR